ncbi:MAG: hypothetical protein AAFY71_20925 [Bacteroidota bacterium]
MTERKAGKIWKSLSKEEKVRFLRFLSAELGDKQLFLQKLANTLKHYPMEDQDVWEVLYPGVSYDDSRLRKLSADLVRWMEEFLAIEMFRKEEGTKGVYLLRYYQERGYDDEFIKAYNKKEKVWEKSLGDHPLAEHFHIKYLMELEKQNFVTKHHFNFQYLKGLKNYHKDTTVNTYLLDSVKAFVEYWLMETISLGMDGTILSLQNPKAEISLFQGLLQDLKEREILTESVHINTYLSLFKSELEEADEKYQQIFEDVRSGVINIPSDDKQNIFAILFNRFAVLLAQKGSKEYVDILIDLIMWGIEDTFLLIDGYLNVTYYRNMINLAIRNGDFEKAHQFLENYKSQLHPIEKEEAYTMAKAVILGSEGNNRELINFLMNKRFKNIRYEIDARTRLLRANFEINPEEEIWIISQINTFQKYLRTKTSISETLKRQSLNFLRFFKLLVKSNNSKQYEKVMVLLQNSQTVLHKKWLLDQLKSKMGRE